MTNRIKRRLEDLEARMKGKPLKVLARIDGKDIIVSARECIDRNGYMIRVMSGNSLKDLDLLLTDAWRKAQKGE